MKFKISSVVFKRVINVMSEFVGKTAIRPILERCRCIVDKESKKATFIATDSYKAVKYCVDVVDVDEDGEVMFVPTKIIQTFVKQFCNDYIDFVTIYTDDNKKVYLNANDNIIKLDDEPKGQYPDVEKLIDSNKYVESQPMFEIDRLISSLKAMKQGGASYVTIKVNENEIGTSRFSGSLTTNENDLSLYANICQVRKFR